MSDGARGETDARPAGASGAEARLPGRAGAKPHAARLPGIRLAAFHVPGRAGPAGR